MTAKTNVPDEVMCSMLNDLNIRRGDALSQSAMKSMKAWISVEYNEGVLTVLQSDIQEELSEVKDERAHDDGAKCGVEDDAKNDIDDEGDEKGDSAGNREIPRSLSLYQAIAKKMGAMESYATRYSQPDFANYLRKAKLLLLLNGTAHSGASGCHDDIREVESAQREASSDIAFVVGVCL